MKNIIIFILLLFVTGCGAKLLEKRFDHRDIISHRYNKEKKLKNQINFGPGPGDGAINKEETPAKGWWDKIYEYWK